jgi:hypothetical protein
MPIEDLESVVRQALRPFRWESLTLAEPVLVSEDIFGVILVLAWDW